MLISNTFVNRKNTAIVIAIILVILGVISIFTLPVAQLPDISPPTVSVRANYIGANAQTVEATVTTQLENSINGTPGAMYISSTSSNDGSSNITVTFNIGVDPDIAALDVQNRVNLALPSLPDEVRRTGVTVRKRSNDMLMVLSINSPKGTHDQAFLSNYLNINMLPVLARVEGVGDVNAFSQDYSMRVWLNPTKMAALNISTSQVANAIQEQNQQVPAGVIGAQPAQGAQAFEYNVKVNGRLTTPEEFSNIVIATNPQNGSLVRLKDVGRVDLGTFSYSTETRPDGKTGTGMAVYLEPGANALATAERVEAKMKDLAKSFPPDVNWLMPFETTSFVSISIHEVVVTLLIALLLVAFVVFIFLENWRATLIPVLVIPVSIIGAFLFLNLFGFSINTLTLFGFVLAIGIVVDDAIVVVEAVQQHIDADKMSPREATLAAMKEVEAPVIAIGLILASVFVPVAFIPGVSGRLYQQFALTIAFSVLISAFLALSLTPALCSMILKPEKYSEKSKGLNWFFFHFNKWFKKETDRYTRGVRWAIRKTPLVVAILLVVFGITFILFKKVPTTFIPQEDMGSIIISAELPDASSTERTKVLASRINQILSSDSSVAHYMGVTGVNFAAGGAAKPNAATYFVSLKPWDIRYKNGQDMKTVVARLQGQFMQIPNARIVTIPSPTLRGFGTSSGFSYILEQRSNGSVQDLANVMGNVLGKANQQPELAQAYAFFSATTPQFNVVVDRDMCKKMGVHIGDVFNTLQTFLGGAYINDFTLFQRNFRVMVQADTVFRSKISELSNYYVPSSQGGMVPLSTLVSTTQAGGPPVINHYNLFRSVEIDGSAKQGFSSGDAITAMERVSNQELPNGYSFEWTNISLQEILAGNKTMMIFMLSILFVFLLLTALYESWSIPFSVLLAVPVALFGSIVALWISGQPNSVYSQIGLITLIGLAAKNAILIVEFAKDRVDSGMRVIPATLEAVRLRFRPILMTSFAFIFGVLPLIFATGAGAASRVNIGFTVLGGMIAATALGVISVPVLYVLITRMGKKKNQVKEESAKA
ncbi:MAG: multidrug efflux RND transporter permease subunit [Chitinophagaceae bacterium]|nr:multidrug efflux RND transporter permease subunit [Chitinophagaceae bacterium]